MPSGGGPPKKKRAVTPYRISTSATPLIEVSNTDTARNEVRQFLGALLAIAFVVATLNVRDGGTMAFASDVVLALCGAWCANQLVRGREIFKEQVICVLQVYFIGLACCAIFLFGFGWLVFLPSEYFHLGSSLLQAATFTTNIGLALFPIENTLRFDGALDHLWVPALIAQCVAIVSSLYWLLRHNMQRLLAVLGLVAFASLSVSSSTSPAIMLLPSGGLWPFLFGAIPFLMCNHYPILRHALLLGIITLLTGVVAATAAGDTLVARASMVLGISFLYLGSRPVSSSAVESLNRRRVFALALHLFLWIVPLTRMISALDLSGPVKLQYGPLLVPTLFLAVISWSIWQRIERRVAFGSAVPTLCVAAVLLITGVAALSSHGAPVRFSKNAQAYLDALTTGSPSEPCPVEVDGPLAGLEVCRIGPKTAPTVLIWGDHQLAALIPGYAEAARLAEVSALVVTTNDCIPLSGLLTHGNSNRTRSGRTCDQHTAQLLQAMPHLESIRQVTLVADWLRYAGVENAEFHRTTPIRLGPNDGSPINPDLQLDYVAEAVERTVGILTDQGLRVSVLRQVPAQPQFDAEVAARANATAQWLYHSQSKLQTSVSLEDASGMSQPVDDMFRRVSAKGRITYVNTWPGFCSGSRCFVRGGLSSEYVTSTILSQSGALSLSAILKDDLKRAKTHSAQKRAHPLGS